MKRLIVSTAMILVVAALLRSTLSAESAAQSAISDPFQELYKGFLDPPRDYSPMPFWLWNGKMDGPTVQSQIREMVRQHVYGAFLYPISGLETPYLSDDWFKAVGAGLEAAKSTKFELNFIDEYDWPSGEARNVWMTGDYQSEVLAQHPEFRMRTLAYDSKVIDGPQSIDLPVDQNVQAVIAARWLGNDRIDDTSLHLLSASVTEGHVRWSAPEGKWVVTQFYLQHAKGYDGGLVDLMDPDAMKLFFHLTYGEYYHRFGSYFGNTIRYSFSDHEGDYGYRIAWTPELFKAFQKRAGYDLRKVLPLLIYDGGDTTTKVRVDYLSTITQLYASSFWSGITDSAKALGIHRTGHAWEESLQFAAALEGNLFAVERGLDPVGVDSLMDNGRQPLNFKVAQSVADYEGRRFMCENEAVQGTFSYLDLEGIRKATNSIGAWGVNLFVPASFDYDANRPTIPPDWLHQPYWPYFHYYADYVRRISYMNASSHHVTNVLLYYPITSIWAHTRPLFSGTADYAQIGRPTTWNNETVSINDYYTQIILKLASHQWDYNIADDQYIEGAHVEGNELVIGPQRFKTVILPPITTLSRRTLEVLQEFCRAGGTILAIRSLPSSSPEAGGEDSVIKAGMASLFGADAQVKEASSSAERRGFGSGQTYYVRDSVDVLIAVLETTTPKDFQVTFGSTGDLYFEHRQTLQVDYYWVVNDAARPRITRVRFATKGIPEKWNALTGEREPLFYVNGPSSTEVRLSMAPWDAYYIVFRPLSGSPQSAELVSTNADTVDSVSLQRNSIDVHLIGPATTPQTFVELRDGGQTYKGEISNEGMRPLSLNGDWQFRPQPERISVQYAKISDASEIRGESLGWTNAAFDDTDWPAIWLNEQNTILNWQVIGPFANPANENFERSFPPEIEFDPAKRYKGLDGRMMGWKDYHADEPRLTLDKYLSHWSESNTGRDDDSGYIVQFDPELLTGNDKWIVSYAHTYLYSLRAQSVQLIVAADNWARLWLNQKLVFSSQLRSHLWYVLDDNWADRIPVELHAGWNEVLLKVGKGGGVASTIYGFSFRVADKDGNTVPDIVAGIAPYQMGNSTAEDSDMRWYRIQIPPGCVGVVPPILHRKYRMLVNGHDLSQGGSGIPIDIRKFLHGEENYLVLISHRDDKLDSPVSFVTGNTPFSLRSWTHIGLDNFSGTAIYTKSFNLPASFQNKRVMINLGRVSSVADIYVNDKHVGTLIWQPYELDITRFIKPGKNELKILVTNTEANRRAVGTWRYLLPQIDVCGMEGPVQIIPYVDQVVALHRVQHE